MSNKKIVLQFDFEGNIGPIKSSVEDLQKSLKNVKIPDNIGANLQKTFSKLGAEFDNFEAIVKSGFDDLGNISKAEKSFGKIINLVNQLSVQAGSINGIDPKKLIPQESLDRIKGLEKAWAAVKEESNKKTNLDREIERQTKEINEQQEALKKLNNEYAKFAAKNNVLGSQKNSKTTSKNATEKRRNEVVTQMTALEGQKGGKSSAEYKALSSEYSSLSQQIKSLESEIRNLDKEIDGNKVEMAGLTTQINSSNEAYEKMKNQLNNLKNVQITPKGLVELRTEIANLTGMNIDEVPQDLEELQKVISGLTNKELDEISKSLVEIKNNSENLPESLNGAKEGMRSLSESGRQVARAADDVENLKNQVLQFFSITNSVQLFKRAITSALNTVKELDATMTEAAVVTEFDVSDMWEKLPEYSKNAQALGVSINGMYQATTLYYQQGLKSNEAMELGIETMKMAKIAGMESAEATEAMTAALRGFNMELNEASATKVNDVYSQLAAVTAADTEQIATAMEKTASIAASANMEFETTAALLAQIIETTQEAPETAGTAMKTIIARFAEVKSLREQGLTSGEDDEGEIIDVNKIQTALRSVGISMEGFFNGTEGLDSVLLKLAEKWGSLDFETQRYIATMAAGSRQQSRFIAMMSDYGRTTELVGQAQNSAGASQKQFEKTQESLATSLTKLQNAWDEFLMGLTNNEILKAGVDGLTKILETINKITEGISGGNGLVKSIVSLSGVLAALKGGKTLLGGTAAGGALSGLMSKITGGAQGEANGKTSIWARPGEIAAQREEARAQQSGKFKKTITTTTYSNKDKSELQRRVGFAATTAEKKGSTDAAQLRSLHEEIKKGNITVEEAQKKFGALNGNIEGLGQTTQKTSYDFDAMGKAANTAGMAMMAAGAATSLLASAFESWGMEEEAETMQKLSGILMGVGPILMGIGSFLPTLTGLTAAQAAATWAALWPILLVVAALGALVAAIVLIAKHQHDISLEGRMEAAAEATERAKEAAEGAKQAYDDLLSAESEYSELQTKLDTLTKGTLEWKQALADSNAQVLELLDKYPKLAEYLTRGEHGELEISEAGWDYITKQQAQATSNANSAVIMSQIDETNLQKEKIEEDLYKVGLESGISKKSKQRVRSKGGRRRGGSKTINVADEQDIQAIYAKYKEMPDIFESEELAGFAESIGQTKDEVLAMKDAIIKYDKELANNEAILQAQSETLLSSQVSDETMGYKYSKELIAGMGAGFAKTQEVREQEIAKNFEYDKNEVAKDSEYFQTLAKEAGVDSTELTGDNTHDLEVLYARMAGISTEEIADGLKGNVDKLTAEIAKIQAAKEAGDQADQVYQAMSKLNEDTQKDYAILMSKDVSNADQNFIKEFSDTNVDQLKQMAADLNFKDELDADGNVIKTATQLMAESFGYKTVEAMETGFEEIAGNVVNEFAKITSKAEKHQINIADKDYLNNMTTGQLQSYVNLLGQAGLAGTKESLEKGFDEIFTEATDEQKGKISSLLETFDWTKEGAGEEFIENVKDMGIEIDWTSESMKGFIEEMKLVNASFRTFSLSEFVSDLESGYKEAMEIASAEFLTTEQYEKFLKEGLINQDDWTHNGEGWINISNGMVDLVNALIDNTEATYYSERAEAQRQLDIYAEQKKKAAESFIKVESYRGGGTFLVDSAYRDSYSNGYSVWTDANSVLDYLVNNDVAESVWSKVFNSQEEYDNFKRMFKGGEKQTNDFLTATENISPELIQQKISKTLETENMEEYYNTYEQLTTIAKQRERLEKYRNKLLEDGNAKLAKQQRDEQRQKLIEERNKQYNLANSKQAEIQSFLSENSDIASMGRLKISEDGTISIDTDAVNNLNTANREKFDEVLSTIEGLRDQMREAQDTAIDVEIQIDDLDKEDRTAYIDITNRIRDALISQRQDEIDELSAINDSINDTNSAILDSLQDQIDEYRQTRDNAKTEEEIAEKQRRLAYLQQDSSGANALAILELQEEIEKAQEDYTDTLIDQKISELQEQNDEAAEQRQEQIDLLEEQLAYDEENGAFYEEAKRLLESAYNSDGTVNEDSEVVKLLKGQEGFDSKSDEEQDEWIKNVVSELSSAYGYKSLSEKDSGESVMPYIVNTNSNASSNSGTNSGNTPITQPAPSTSSGSGKIASLSDTVASKMSANEIETLQEGLNNLIADGKIQADNLNVNGIYDVKTTEAVKALQQEIGESYIDGKWGPNTRRKFHASHLNTYKTGGLADFTGPAWLDGTKSKPEYILNADQTKAFFTLVDVLSGLKSTTAQSTQNNGEYHYDIDINVEKMDSDTDLEEIARKIEDMIVESSSYRNNNTL